MVPANDVSVVIILACFCVIVGSSAQHLGRQMLSPSCIARGALLALLLRPSACYRGPVSTQGIGRATFRTLSTNEGIVEIHTGEEWALLWKTSNVFVRTADQQGSTRTRRLASESVERFILGQSRRKHIVTPLNEMASGIVFVGSASDPPTGLQATWVAILQGSPPFPPDEGIILSIIETHGDGLSLVKIQAPLREPASALMSWLGASLVPSSSSGVFLSLVDASSSSSSSSLHRFVLDMHQANVLPRPVPAKMTKHLRRHGLLHARKAEAAHEEEEAEGRAETMRTFRGLELLVPRAGLVPKESSGVLVDAAVAVLRQAKGKGKRAAILDLGTGSGALLLATLKEEAAGESVGVGIDLDVDALEAARRNALTLGLASQTTFIRMDFGLLHEGGGASSLSLSLAPSSSSSSASASASASAPAAAAAAAAAPAAGFSVVVSNPPYLAASKAAGRVTSEGGLALVGGGNDGLGSYFAICSSLSRLVDQHPALLSPDCVLVLQLPGGDGAAAAVRGVVEAVSGTRFRWTEVLKDARGVKRAAILRLVDR